MDESRKSLLIVCIIVAIISVFSVGVVFYPYIEVTVASSEEYMLSSDGLTVRLEYDEGYSPSNDIKYYSLIEYSLDNYAVIKYEKIKYKSRVGYSGRGSNFHLLTEMNLITVPEGVKLISGDIIGYNRYTNEYADKSLVLPRWLRVICTGYFGFLCTILVFVILGNLAYLKAKKGLSK